MIDFTRLTEYNNLEYSDVKFEQNRILVPHQHKWSHRGHTFNEGMISDDGNYFYLNISKNNSSFVKKVLTSLGWQFASLSDYKNHDSSPQVLVILRDPMERWISGIVEYLFLYHIDVIDHSGFYSPEMGFQRMLGQTLGLDLLCKHVTFDDHTERQCAFLTGVDLHRVTWFHAKHQFNQTFSAFLQELGYNIDLSQAQPVNQDVDVENFSFHNKRRHMKKMFTDYLELFTDTKAQIARHFACDYYLMDSVKYYGS